MSILKVDLERVRQTAIKAGASVTDIDGILMYVAEAARARWIQLAMGRLRSTARDYVQGLAEVEVKNRVATIALEGKLPNMLEQGWKGGDMRHTVIGGPATKTAADGSRYVNVPFRHGTPGTSGANVGRPMPRAIHNAAKALGGSLSRPGGGTKWGERLDIGSRTSTRRADDIMRTKERPHHWGSIYRGMVRMEKTYEGATQSAYMTWRRISTNVKHGSQHWVHPGLRALNLVREVEDYVASILGAALARSGS